MRKLLLLSIVALGVNFAQAQDMFHTSTPTMEVDMIEQMQIKKAKAMKRNQHAKDMQMLQWQKNEITKLNAKIMEFKVMLDQKEKVIQVLEKYVPKSKGKQVAEALRMIKNER